MSFRDFLASTDSLITIDKPVSVEYELANVASTLRDQVVMFTNIKEHPGWRVCANPCARRDYFSQDLGVPVEQLLHKMADALANPVAPEIVESAPCQEVVIEQPDLNDLPFLLHLPTDAGYYCASDVAIINDPDTGRNMSYHRILRVNENQLAARIIENRGTHTAMQKTDGDLPIALCIGVTLAVHLAGSMGPPPGVDELAVANALQETRLVKCLSNDLHVPADAEIVLEGRVTRKRAKEGPFMDLTETMDVTRDGPVIEIDLITHRRDPIYHALLPGGMEHKTLMGMPKEPTIFAEVNKVVDCRNAVITPGGTSWLHAVVQIEKKSADDGRLAIEAAYKGHGSLKHVWVVDTDIDPYDAAQVEWALATRFQADKDLYIFKDKPGSSLDPSGTHEAGKKSRTAKMGLDCTIEWGRERKGYERGEYGEVNLDDYL